MKKNNINSSAGKILIIVALLIILSITIFKLFPAYRQYSARREESRKIRQTNARLKKELRQRTIDVNALENSPAAVEKVAREKYNQVKDGETVMTYPIAGKNVKK